MKKMLAALLVLLLCLQCVPTLAAGTVHYEDPDGEFSASVPAEWLCLNKHNVQNYITAMIDGTFSFPGIETTMLSTLRTQIEMANMHIFICNANNNMTIRCVDFGAPVTEQQFAANMLPQINQNIKASIPGIQYEDEGSVKMFGDKRFVATLAYYNVYGVPAVVDALYYLEGTKMYEITITSRTSDDPTEQSMFYEQVMNFIESFATKGESTPAVQPSGGLGEYTSFADNYKSPAEETEATQPEQSAAYNTYTHPTQGFSIVVPAEWIAVDRTNIQSRIDAAAAGQISVPNVNMHRLMTNMQAQIEANDMVVFVDGNANCMTVAIKSFGQVITYDQYEEQVLPMVMNSYSAKAGYREIIGGERVVYGGKEFIVIEVEFGTGNSRAHILQLAYIDGADLYAITTNTLPLYDQTVIDAFNTAVLDAAATIVSVK